MRAPAGAPDRPAPDADGRLTVVDFRYHLVSIIAVFLALAVGIVVGTAALNGPVLDSLRGSITRLTEDKRTLETDVATLRSEVQASDDFALGIAPTLVRGSLSGERVLLVVTPETPADLAERLVPVLAEAGASVTGQLSVLPALSDPEQRLLIEDLVAEVVPAGVELPDGSPVERAAAELAAALAVQGGDSDAEPGADGIDAGEAQAVVSAFQEADLVEFSSDDATLRQATLVVVLGGPAPTTEPDEEELETELEDERAVLALARAFQDRADGVVVAGPTGSGDATGLVGLLREDSGTAAQVSSVDNADRGVGVVAVVQALAEQQAGAVGQYGSGAGSSGPLPTTAPAS